MKVFSRKAPSKTHAKNAKKKKLYSVTNSPGHLCPSGQAGV